jgi:hypothetical protein
MREKTVKLSAEHYEKLSRLAAGQRQRAAILEGLIDALEKAASVNRYLVYDIITTPDTVRIKKA